MSYRITGLHHVTAMSAHIQANIDFYTGVLGLKLVKINVNQDDPTSLHLYYGDETGSPGSLVTFFIYPGMQRGQVGWPQVERVSLWAPTAQVKFWHERVNLAGAIDPERKSPDLGRVSKIPYVPAVDPEGLRVGLEGVHYEGRTNNRVGTEEIPASAALRGICTGFLLVDGTEWVIAETSARWIAHHLDLESHEIWPSGPYALTTHSGKKLIEVHGSPYVARGRPGAGTVHHIAFRISTGEEQEELHAKLTEAGVGVSPIIDRFYFKSIYFREPGGIRLEVATDGPGFAVDEEPDKLGQTLCLPPWLEHRRDQIEAAVPKFRNPNLQREGGLPASHSRRKHSPGGSAAASPSHGAQLPR